MGQRPRSAGVHPTHINGALSAPFLRFSCRDSGTVASPPRAPGLSTVPPICLNDLHNFQGKCWVWMGLETVAGAEHEVLGLLEVAEAVAGVEEEVRGDKGFECELLVKAVVAYRGEHVNSQTHVY